MIEKGNKRATEILIIVFTQIWSLGAEDKDKPTLKYKTFGFGVTAKNGGEKG